MAKDDGHDYHGPKDHPDQNDSDTCQACVLSYCKTCHGAEASLTSQCPGRSLTRFEEAAVMACLLDHRDGEWVLLKDGAAALLGMIDEQTDRFFGLPKVLKDAALDDSRRLPSKMTPAVAEVIGTPCFACMTLVGALRELGHDIAHKAEAEQAAYIWFLLPFAIKYGTEWRKHVVEELKRQREERKA